MTDKKDQFKNPCMNKELEKAEKSFQSFENDVKEMTLDRMNEAPKLENEPQVKMSQREMQNSNDVYLKPVKRFDCRMPFNEKWRKDYEFDKEYVKFMAENREIQGDKIECWTKKYPGQPYEFWEVPVNKPIWGPRYLAQRLKDCQYHRLRMEESAITGNHGHMGQTYGTMVVDNTINRLDAIPVSDRKSIFLGASGF